jgi:hypothetical protein
MLGRTFLGTFRKLVSILCSVGDREGKRSVLWLPPKGYELDFTNFASRDWVTIENVEDNYRKSISYSWLFKEDFSRLYCAWLSCLSHYLPEYMYRMHQTISRHKHNPQIAVSLDSMQSHFGILPPQRKPPLSTGRIRAASPAHCLPQLQKYHIYRSASKTRVSASEWRPARTRARKRGRYVNVWRGVLSWASLLLTLPFKQREGGQQF